MISCGRISFPIGQDYYTRDEIEALDNEKIEAILLFTASALRFEPFFSRRFWVVLRVEN